MKRREVQEKAKIGWFTKDRVGGKHNINWKGGIWVKQTLRSIREGNDYRKWRKAVFERDKYTCQLCGKTGTYIEADHIKPFADFPSLRLELSNGRTLCRECHKTTPTFGSNYRWTRQKYSQ